ncbi:hypothetical protein N7495_009274 [Penicillium taxi]|uniref:uncharacterized protein n=1 Tax=Penicillium taxi TaxID=168475 RepID=UPI0025455517|nr:uncharacterized protein N7495_009274 [Penicillium taxi]KAJ5884764.1 hypothetical protein N7495_009274 [Penicillium taxi]
MAVNMRLFQCILLALIVVELQAATFEATEFPECAVNCSQKLFTDCVLSNNTTCVCSPSSWATELLDCVQTECLSKDIFTTRRLWEKGCDIPILKGPSAVQGSTLVPLILATVFFIGRIFAKSSGLAGGWGWDDYTIIVSFVMIASLGFGQNIWDIPFETITEFYKGFQVVAITYKIQISLAKISVCLFLLRIFQTTYFCRISYVLITVNALTGIAWAFVDSFRCIPIKLTWLGWTDEVPGTCINFIDSILVNCIVNIIVDSIMVIMPVYEVVRLKLPMRKKLAVALMFIVASVLTVIAIIRVVVFWNNRWGYNQTFGLYPVVQWSIIETQIAVLCACLPSSRAIAGRYFPASIGGTSKPTYPSHGVEYSGSTSRTAPGTNVDINKSITYSVSYSSHSEDEISVELFDVELAKRPRPSFF